MYMTWKAQEEKLNILR